MLRRVDRFLAPVVWAAAAVTVLLLLAGPSLIGAKADKPATTGSSATGGPDGKDLFASNCGSCHTLASAGTNGNVGPNLDDLKPDAATVSATVRSGKGTMPAFEDTLSGAEIAAVAAFVAGEEPATATPEPAEVTTTDTAPGPDGITVANDRVFVTNASAGTLQRFDASTGRAIGVPLAVGRQPDNPLVVSGDIWVALGGDDAVARVEGSQVTRIAVGDAPEDLAVAGGNLWVTNAGDGTVSRIDRASGRVAGPPIRVGGRPLGIAASGGTVWVSSFDDGTVWRLDAATGARRGEPIKVGAKPRGVAAGGGTAWVANSGGDSVTRLRDGKTVPVGDNPRDLAVAGGSVWVANAGDDTLTRIDAATGEPVGDPTKVGDDPTGVAVGGGAAWATGFRDDTLSRVPIEPTG